MGILEWLIVIIPFAMIMGIGSASCSNNSSSNNQYSEVFGKDPNDWNNDDKEYVNDLFDWIDEQNQ